MQLDKTHHAILACLKHNARQSWQAIGQQVHLTGQAVAARVAQLEDMGMISGYTIRQKDAPHHFITVFMHDGQFDAFERFLRQSPCVEEAYKIAGEGCYHVVVEAENSAELEPFLNALLAYGRYKVASSIRCVV